MPTVNYNCKQCRYSFKKIFMMGDKEEIPICPKCNSTNVGKSIAPERVFEGISNYSSMGKDTN